PCEDATRQAEALTGPQDRLVGEGEDDVRIEALEGIFPVVDDRDTLPAPSAQLLHPSDEQGPDDLVGQLPQRVAHDRRVVLAVDESERATHGGAAPRSIFAVSFSNAGRSKENWMMRFCP